MVVGDGRGVTNTVAGGRVGGWVSSGGNSDKKKCRDDSRNYILHAFKDLKCYFEVVYLYGMYAKNTSDMEINK